MSNQQYVKNTNVPPEGSELWSIAEGWKISGSDGLAYTKLSNVFQTPNDHTLVDTLTQQLNGDIKQSLDIGLQEVLVAYYSQDGTALVKAWPKNRAAEADKKASYNKKRDNIPQQQTITTKPTITTPKITTPTEIPPAKGIIQSQKVSQIIEVPYDIVMVEWDDAPAIEQVEATGRFVLPVKFTGVENWGFVGENGKRTFYYGRIKLVRVQEE